MKLSETKHENGLEIKPLENHINRYVTVNNVEDWAKAIFVSPSIFYSANAAYAKVIQSCGKEWLILIEARAKIGSYVTRESTVFNYKYMEGEPKDDIEFRIEKECDVIVISICFLEKNFFRQIKDFKEGSIFEENYRYLNKYKGNEYNIYETMFDQKKIKKILNDNKIRNDIYNMKYLSKYNIHIDSKIIKRNVLYQHILKKWIEKPNESLKKKIIENIELIYRGNRDSFQSRQFHNRCDIKSETLVIIQ